MFNNLGYHLGLYIKCKNTVLFEKNRIYDHFSKKTVKNSIKGKTVGRPKLFHIPVFLPPLRMDSVLR